MQNRSELAQASEIAAALALGRLDGALAHCGESALRILAGGLVRDTLIAALRQEGHAFTEPRFHAWFAGLATLSDLPVRHARPPRVLCAAILTELRHSSWAELRDLSTRLHPALLAPQDLEEPQAHATVHAVIADARILLDTLASGNPEDCFSTLAALYDAIGRSVRFAPGERQAPTNAPGLRRQAVDRPPPPSPRWAIEMLYGETLRHRGSLCRTLPLPGLIRLDALSDGDAGEGSTLRADGLRRVAQGLCERLAEAHAWAGEAQRRRAGQRATSRAPALFELLAGFGPMRSAQLETALAATRLGIRGMIARLEDDGVIARTTISGSHLHALVDRREPLLPRGREAETALPTDALDEFEASLAEVDRLLAARSD
jgi:hypothetical protein